MKAYLIIYYLIKYKNIYYLESVIYSYNYFLNFINKKKSTYFKKYVLLNIYSL